MHFSRLALWLPMLVFSVSMELEAKPKGEMQIKPKLCVVRGGEEQCHTDIDIRWSATEKQDYCVFADESLAALRCWDQESVGSLQDRLETRKDMPYRLVWIIDEQQTELDRVVLKVISVVPEDRRRSRRRRHIWSVF